MYEPLSAIGKGVLHRVGHKFIDHQTKRQGFLGRQSEVAAKDRNAYRTEIVQRFLEGATQALQI